MVSMKKRSDEKESNKYSLQKSGSIQDIEHRQMFEKEHQLVEVKGDDIENDF